MSFVKWKTRTKTFRHIPLTNYADVVRACQAAYKAGERDGRKQVEVMARAAIALRDKLKESNK